MKKIILFLFLSLFMILMTNSCKEKMNITLKKSPKNILFSILNKQINCIPVELTVYKDNTYELFTAYKSCEEDKICTAMLEYTKSIKGKYDYDVMKIIDTSKEFDNMMDKPNDLIDYEIYIGTSLMEKGYNSLYVIEKERENYIDEFLTGINVDLNMCAQSE